MNHMAGLLAWQVGVEHERRGNPAAFVVSYQRIVSDAVAMVPSAP